MQNRIPLLEAMLEYKKAQVYPFHTPGHKGGRGLVKELLQELDNGAMQMDVSLMNELDDLHQPQGCLAQAQSLAAQLYGADKCFFAVNGTTGAIHAMLMAACPQGSKVLMPRNAHRSIVGALLLGGLEAVFINPLYDEEFGINTQITAQQVSAVLQKHHDISAVLVTSPNYYGQAADLQAIAEIVHQYGATLLVDEAHGPHLGFHPDSPLSALQCGADACAQSTHKILGAFTQCSMLQICGQRIDLERAQDVMSFLTTTSPNYLLLASLDAARYQLAMFGQVMMKQAFNAAQQLREALQCFEGLRLLTKDCVGKKGVFAFDATKVTVNLSGWGISGIEAGAALREAGIAVELTDADNVLFLVTYSDQGLEYADVVQKIKKVFINLEQIKRQGQRALAPAMLPKVQTILPLRQAFDAKKISIPLVQAEGKIAGEQVSFYPPGIPVILPGEMITAEIITYCQNMKGLGLTVNGTVDGSLTEIRVVQ